MQEQIAPEILSPAHLASILEELGQQLKPNHRQWLLDHLANPDRPSQKSAMTNKQK